MSLKYGKAEITAIEDVLNGDYETVGEAARAVLAAAEDIFEKRAKFVVVGQLKSSSERPDIPPTDPEAIKLSLGWYSTEGDARSAGESLWHSSASGDTFRWWVLPVFHGTPADLHKTRKEQYAAAAEKAKEVRRERFKAAIAKRQEDMAIREAGGKGSCEHCAHPPYEHSLAGEQNARGKCYLPDCNCPKWKERKK